MNLNKDPSSWAQVSATVNEKSHICCPGCGLPLYEDEVYRAGYDGPNFRVIPTRYGRGNYCDHIKKAVAGVDYQPS